MKCPLCQVDLVMTERHGVEIDYCPKCRGVWLDRGELDKIIEKAVGPTVTPEPDGPRAPQPHVWREPYRDPPPAPRPEERYGQSDRNAQSGDRPVTDRKTRRKSILAEIFDFD